MYETSQHTRYRRRLLNHAEMIIIWQKLKSTRMVIYLLTSFYQVLMILTAQKMKFAIKDFFSKCDQICSFMRIWSHLLKKSLMDKFIVCAVQCFSSASCFVKQFLSSLYFFEKIFYVFHESTQQYLKKNSRSNNSFWQKSCCENFLDLQVKEPTIKPF